MADATALGVGCIYFRLNIIKAIHAYTLCLIKKITVDDDDRSLAR